jgi:hypothetical protein
VSRDELEAVIWQHWPTRGTLAGRSVDAILNAADAYADTRTLHEPREPRRALHHVSGSDLFPVIGLLAEAMEGAP